MQQRIYRVMLVACLAVLAHVLSACQVTPQIVKIGLVAPFSGKDRDLGYDVIYAARLAVRQINSQDGIDGRRIALVALDDGGDPAMARQAAASLVVDGDVLGVLGHWLPQTTAAAQPVYDKGGLLLLPAGRDPLGKIEPGRLPPEFLASYRAVTPFDEVAGPYAGTTYDAMHLLFSAIDQASRNLSREGLAYVLPEIEIQGITGTVFQP
jgi:ABC-type branched-subunit amino acid transport system substrate-binding protein